MGQRGGHEEEEEQQDEEGEDGDNYLEWVVQNAKQLFKSNH